MRNGDMIHAYKPFLISAITGLAVSLSACSNASSADATATASASATTAPAQDTVGNWDILPEASHIRFSAKQEGALFTGEFQTFSGVINFDPAAPEKGSVEITIPLKSVDAGSNDRNSTLPGKIWFSAKAFPNAVYTSSDISAEGDAYVSRGELTLKGVSIPFRLPFNLDVQEGRAVMTSTVEMDRTDWNVGAAPWDTDEWVSRVVTLDIKVTAQKLN